MKKRTPKYVESIEWIAINDSAGEAISRAELAATLTVLFASDLFGVPPGTVAGDVLDYRREPFSGRVELRREWVALLKRGVSR